MKKTCITATVLITLLLIVAPGFSYNITGKWQMHTGMDASDTKNIYNFNIDGTFSSTIKGKPNIQGKYTQQQGILLITFMVGKNINVIMLHINSLSSIKATGHFSVFEPHAKDRDTIIKAVNNFTLKRVQ